MTRKRIAAFVAADLTETLLWTNLVDCESFADFLGESVNE